MSADPQKMTLPDLPLKCIAHGDVLRIEIGAATLKCVTESHPDYWDDEADRGLLLVDDPAAWLRSVVHQANAERADGSSLLTDFLDKAIKQAAEQGDEGLYTPEADNAI